MPNWGIKATKPTYGVGNAKDYNLSFSSSWPLLKIAYQGRVTIKDRSTSQTIVTHNFGYPPAFWVFDNPGGTTSRYRSYGNIDGGEFAVSTTELRYISNSLTSGPRDIYYYIFRLPLTTNFEADIINTSTEDTFNDNSSYGIKVTKEGHDITSNDLRDYVIHSGSRMPLIHAVQTGPLTEKPGYIFPNGYMKQYFHNLGYTPLVFCYVNHGANGSPYYDPNYWYIQGGIGGVSTTQFIPQPDLIRIEDDHNPSTMTACFVVFKDPRDGVVTNVSYP
jgi:hypothetical protein